MKKTNAPCVIARPPKAAEAISKRDCFVPLAEFTLSEANVLGVLAMTLTGIFCHLNFVICDSAFAEEFTYSSKGKRDPFIPLVGPYALYQVKGAVDIKSIEDVNLEGIVYDAKGPSTAIINGMILKEGDQAGMAIIDKIEPKKVIILIEEKRYEVVLGGGKGGE